MSFYQQQLTEVRPAEVPAEYGNSIKYDYREEAGAIVAPLAFLVDLQPVSMVRMPDGTRVDPTETRFKFFTPPGRDLQVRKHYRYRWRDQEFDVDGFRRWPSADYPSGVDHVVVELVLREG
ncbi:head-to-tail stopper [Gordonia phage Archimedes]|uniref:Head-to-tail stopper n=1 Tax=Gordonia phage Archimedes TaxID=2759389 RepID=A0A7L7SNJ4_9CAUD|nr:head-to-tail stopper [Gordonia phage Archimedes]QOC55707.1 head-to-tail stopper [Gordonia phage Archimedes]